MPASDRFDGQEDVIEKKRLVTRAFGFAVAGAVAYSAAHVYQEWNQTRRFRIDFSRYESLANIDLGFQKARTPQWAKEFLDTPRPSSSPQYSTQLVEKSEASKDKIQVVRAASKPRASAQRLKRIRRAHRKVTQVARENLTIQVRTMNQHSIQLRTVWAQVPSAKILKIAKIAKMSEPPKAPKVPKVVKTKAAPVSTQSVGLAKKKLEPQEPRAGPKVKLNTQSQPQLVERPVEKKVSIHVSTLSTQPSILPRPQPKKPSVPKTPRMRPEAPKSRPQIAKKPVKKPVEYSVDVPKDAPVFEYSDLVASTEPVALIEDEEMDTQQSAPKRVNTQSQDYVEVSTQSADPSTATLYVANQPKKPAPKKVTRTVRISPRPASPSHSPSKSIIPTPAASSQATSLMSDRVGNSGIKGPTPAKSNRPAATPSKTPAKPVDQVTSSQSAPAESKSEEDPKPRALTFEQLKDGKVLAQLFQLDSDPLQGKLIVKKPDSMEDDEEPVDFGADAFPSEDFGDEKKIPEPPKDKKPEPRQEEEIPEEASSVGVSQAAQGRAPAAPPYYEAVQRNTVPVQTDEVRVLSHEGHARDSGPKWIRADASGYWSTIALSDRRTTVPFLKENTIRVLGMIAGVEVREDLGIVFGKVQEGWTLTLSDKTSPVIWFDKHWAPIIGGEQPFESADAPVPQYFVHLNVGVGAHTVRPYHSKTQKQGSVLFEVKRATATWVDLSQPEERRFEGDILDGFTDTDRYSIDQHPGLANVSVKVIGQASETQSDPFGRFILPGVQTFGNYRVYFDTIRVFEDGSNPDGVVEDRQRHVVAPAQMQNVLVSHLNVDEVRKKAAEFQRKANGSRQNFGLLVADLGENFSDSHNVEGMRAKVVPIGALADADTHVFSVNLESSLSTEALIRERPRFVGGNYPQGNLVAEVTNSKGEVLWSQMVLGQDQVVTVIEPL